MNYEPYAIPGNFTEAGRILGLFEIRNFVEAVLLTVPAAFLFMICLPLPFSVRVFATLLVLIPLGGFALMGIGGDSLMRWLYLRRLWHRRRRLLLYRGEL